jgi:hypothetical protein
MLSAVDIPVGSGIDFVRIPALKNLTEWNVFVTRDSLKYMDCKFAMSVHEDGFPIRPDLWNPLFLHFDYIGPVWNDMLVGSGGFNIESGRLLRMKASMWDGDNTIPSDFWVCRKHRDELQQRAITFAPPELAICFGTETTHQDFESFGFHGRNYAPMKYASGWGMIEKALNENKSPIHQNT